MEAPPKAAITSDLFAKSEIKHNAILLVDASGSVASDHAKFNGVHVFDKIREIVKQFDEDDFRIIFWNSDQDPAGFFKGGVYRLPFVVKKSTLDQTFAFIKPNIKGNCLTYPHLGFNNIPADWINPKEPTKIYYITDGEIGYGNCPHGELQTLKMNLRNSIQNIFNKYSNVQLVIITVEPRNRNFGEMESLQNAAGSDVYKIVNENRLTQFITKFISYTPNNLQGFAQINRVIPPPGFIPYGEKYFSELRMPDFIKYLSETITAISNEDDLVKIVQYLSGTVSKLTRDKPKKIVDDIVNTFCGLFANTTLDPMFVKFILTDAVQKENAGTANVFAAYRAQLKDLYRQATELLLKNVRDAIGIREYFVSLPIHDKIISGHARLIDRNISVTGKNYPQSAWEANGVTIPILPLDAHGFSAMNEQCLRQWTRVIISRMYNVNALEDIVIYIVLGLCIKVVLSPIDEKIKSAYRRLATVMLKKKRMNTDCTELDRFENGELPIPNNGKIETFYAMMNTVGTMLGLKLEPLTIWYAMCLAIANDKLVVKQMIHCADSIERDFPGTEPRNLLTKITGITPVTYHEIPFETILDYSCIITMEDTSKTGGYRFLPHQNNVGATCSPVYVLSQEGYQQLRNNQQSCVCPICYTYLNDSNFARVNPKPEIVNNDIFAAGTIDVFKSDAKPAYSPMVNLPVAPASKMDKTGLLVIMKGTVGSGKSTYGMRIKEAVEKMGGYCCVTGTDKYCKTGIAPAIAANMVQNELRDVGKVANDMIVCVIDTCGEKNNGDNIFGVNFAGWKKVNFWPNLDRNNMEGYLCWSLRNVLRRAHPGANDNHYLNPDDAGVQTCITVHKKKAEAHFGKKIPKIVNTTSPSKSHVIGMLDERADNYEKIIAEKMPIDAEIEKIINANIKK